jgi:hypothetical protein
MNCCLVASVARTVKGDQRWSGHIALVGWVVTIPKRPEEWNLMYCQIVLIGGGFLRPWLLFGR